MAKRPTKKAPRKPATSKKAAPKPTSKRGKEAGGPDRPLRDDLTPVWPPIDSTCTMEAVYAGARLLVDCAFVDAGWGLYGLFIPAERRREFNYPGGDEAWEKDWQTYSAATEKLGVEARQSGPAKFSSEREFGAELRSLTAKLKFIAVWHGNVVPVYEGYARTRWNYASTLRAIEEMAHQVKMKVPSWPDTMTLHSLIRWCDELLQLNEIPRKPETITVPAEKPPSGTALPKPVGSESGSRPKCEKCGVGYYYVKRTKKLDGRKRQQYMYCNECNHGRKRSFVVGAFQDST